MSLPYITLEDSESNVYSFPDSIWIDSQPVQTNKNVVNKTYASGGKNKADGFLGSKNITLSGTLYADTNALLEVEKRALVKACLKGGKLRLSDDSVSRYIDVKNPDFEFNHGSGPSLDIQIIFLAENPFWKDYTETENENILTGDDSFTIDNSGSDFILFPIIEIENDQGVDNPGVKLKNSSDGGMEIVYNDSSFLSGDILIIDSEQGTIQKNNNDAMANVSGNPRFLRLQPNINTIYYEGAACTVRFKFKKVYLI